MELRKAVERAKRVDDLCGNEMEWLRTLIEHAETIKRCDDCGEWCENAFGENSGCPHWCQSCFDKESEAWCADWEKHCAEVQRKESGDVSG